MAVLWWASAAAGVIAVATPATRASSTLAASEVLSVKSILHAVVDF
jgi:hypothetical protein